MKKFIWTDGNLYLYSIQTNHTETSHPHVPNSYVSAQQYQQQYSAATDQFGQFTHVPSGFILQNQPSPQQILSFLPNSVMSTQVQNNTVPHEKSHDFYQSHEK